MKPPITLLKLSARKRGRLIVLAILLVSAKVNSACLEQDCPVNKSIRVVNATTGKCVTCYPCTEMCSYGSPSVPCGSTVPYGTDISCDGDLSKGQVKIIPACLEQDCPENKSIIVVNATTGKCVTCYPCTEMCSYGSPSVPCGSTVPYGTDINCDGPNQDAPFTSLQLATSLVTPLYSSHLARSRMTSTPSMAVTVSSSLSPSSTATFNGSVETESKLVAPSSSSAFNTAGSKGIPKHTEPGSPPTHSQKQHPSTLISVFTVSGAIIGAFLLLVLIPFVYKKCRKNTTKKHRSTNVSRDQQKGGLIELANEDSETCALYPDTNSASFVNSCHKKSKESVNNHSHSVELPIDSEEGNGAIVVAIPTSLDSDSSKGDQDSVSSDDQSPDSNSQINLQQVKNTHYFAGPGAQYQKIFSATQQTGCTQPDRWNGNAVGSNKRGCVNWSSMSQEDKYKTCILEVPFRLLRGIYLSLDVKRTDGKDVGLFAEKLFLTHKEYEFVCQEAQNNRESPTYLLLKEKFNYPGSVRKFIEIMKSMGREDIIRLINDWQS
ncbi:uncharacterized protein [Montipora foliosa]|uniref:uncharacterized protein n=1 Tax=Montipora foliosa TaxID=591990 RepID=UPI0035F16050